MNMRSLFDKPPLTRETLDAWSKEEDRQDVIDQAVSNLASVGVRVDPFVFEGDIVLESGNSRSGDLPPVSKSRRQDEVSFAQDSAELYEEKAKKKTNHSSRTKSYCDKRGWISTPCEMKDLFFDGHMSRAGKKHDLFGLFDRIAIDVANKKLIGIQVVSTSLKKPKGASRRDHLRKMCSTDLESKSKSPYVVNLRAWLACGFDAIILDWEQRPKVGAQEWFEVVTYITEEMIQEVESRRRKAA